MITANINISHRLINGQIGMKLLLCVNDIRINGNDIIAENNR